LIIIFLDDLIYMDTRCGETIDMTLPSIDTLKLMLTSNSTYDNGMDCTLAFITNRENKLQLQFNVNIFLCFIFYGVPFEQSWFFSLVYTRDARCCDGTMVKIRWYDDENAMVRCWNCNCAIVRWWKYNVTSRFHHRASRVRTK
jgi:hypothetical protein